MFTPEALASYFSAAILTAINLAIAYIILKKILFKPLLRLYRKRREQVSGQLRQAEEKGLQAQKNFDMSQKQLTESSHQAAQIIAGAKETAEQENEKILAQAHEQARQLLRQAKDDIRRQARSAEQDREEELTDLAVAIAAQVIGESLDSQQQRARIQELIRHSAQLESAAKAQTAGTGSQTQAEVDHG